MFLSFTKSECSLFLLIVTQGLLSCQSTVCAPKIISHSSKKAESPKAVAPTTAGPGYHLAPGNTAESRRRRQRSHFQPSSNNEQ